MPTLDNAPEKLATFICDVTKEDEVKAFVDGAYAAFGSIDVVIPTPAMRANTSSSRTAPTSPT